MTTKAEFVSPITGRLAVYDQVRMLNAFEPLQGVDSPGMINATNTELYNQGVDSLVTEVHHISTGIVDYVEVVGWVPESIASAGEYSVSSLSIIGALTAIVVSKIFQFLIAVVVIAVAATWAVGLYKETAYPSLYYGIDPTTGEMVGPMPRESMVTWNASMYPNWWVDPTTTLVVDPTQPDAAEKIDFIERNTPDGWGEAGGDTTDQIIMLLIVGGVVVGGLMVLPTVLRAFKKGN